jgi:hypothetical protein
MEPGTATELKVEGVDTEPHPWYNTRFPPTTIEDKP